LVYAHFTRYMCFSPSNHVHVFFSFNCVHLLPFWLHNYSCCKNWHCYSCSCFFCCVASDDTHLHYVNVCVKIMVLKFISNSFTIFFKHLFLFKSIGCN
jgi:hypothetical protein